MMIRPTKRSSLRCLQALEAEGWRAESATHYTDAEGYERARWEFVRDGQRLIGIAHSDDEAIYIAFEDRITHDRIHGISRPAELASGAVNAGTVRGAGGIVAPAAPVEPAPPIISRPEIGEWEDPVDHEVVVSAPFAPPRRHREADIVINGRRLTFAQSMAVRVAVSGFLMELADPERMIALGPIGPAYQARLSEVQDIIVDPLSS